MVMRLKAMLGLACIAWAFACQSSHAQQFPSQPLRMILGFSPGGLSV